MFVVFFHNHLLQKVISFPTLTLEFYASIPESSGEVGCGPGPYTGFVLALPQNTGATLGVFLDAEDFTYF